MATSRKKSEPITESAPGPVEDRIERLRELVPEAFSEGKIDWERLRAALGDAVDDRPERYQFTWAGKRDAIRMLQTPSRATLVADREESVNFDDTKNIFIEGENLEVLKLLYKPYFGRIKMIYIDPPYNTGNDFVYPDDFSDPLENYLRLSGQKDAEGNLLTSNPEKSGRFHSAWLSMMYPRLWLARQLLREDGVIFVSIDDNEVHNLRMLMNEVFGEENFLASIAWEKRYTRGNNARLFYSLKDSILVYRRSDAVQVLREARTDKANAIYGNPDNDPRGPWTSSSYVNPAKIAQRPNLSYPIARPGSPDEIRHPTHAWKYERAEHERHVLESRLWWGANGDAKYPRLKVFLSESDGGLVPIDLWDYRSTGTTDEGGQEVKALFGESVFDNPKPSRLIRRMLQLVTDPEGEDIILDFFSGAATTAHAVCELNQKDNGNRRFILVQLPEPTEREDYPTISSIGRERIRRALASIPFDSTNTHSEPGDERNQPDLGFRAFRLAEPHLRPWRENAAEGVDEYLAQLEMMADPLVDGADPVEVIREVALREGYGLTSRIEPDARVPARNVYRVSDPDTGQSFHATLAEEVRLEDVRALALGRDDLFVCRDSALDDATAANLALQCRLKTL